MFHVNCVYCNTAHDCSVYSADNLRSRIKPFSLLGIGWEYGGVLHGVRNYRDISTLKLISSCNFDISDTGYHMENAIYLVLELDRGKLTEALCYSIV
jgi:hypothetical protein